MSCLIKTNSDAPRQKKWRSSKGESRLYEREREKERGKYRQREQGKKRQGKRKRKTDRAKSETKKNKMLGGLTIARCDKINGLPSDL